MANHKSAIKRARQNEIRRLRNKAARTRIKKLTKSLRQAGAEDTAAVLNQAKSVIDKAAKKGVIHKNTAARKTSRLSRIANTAGS
ncbi:MAG: 30S ribosomal protein S20 [Deltaproteobacteria bacterium SG8_13]|nr:MAG: 30S ribosomal protein S20 [Deltaproteobacteria bacterium SG8_13]